jgi:hypothetical protein
MYCPQCGGTNDDAARVCSVCGMDMEKYRQQWASSPGAQSAGQPPYQQSAPAYQQPYQQPAQQAPAYQQAYQQPYQQPYQQQYQAPYQQQYVVPQYRPISSSGFIANVPSYMGWSIAVMIVAFCLSGFGFLGIIALVYSSQVGNKLAIGDYAGAQHSSGRAKMWCWITFGVMLAMWAIYILIIVAAFSTGDITY